MTEIPFDTSEARARSLDAADPLASNRSRCLLPTAADGAPRVYLAGQSLGAQPIAARAAVEAELEAWARLLPRCMARGDDLRRDRFQPLVIQGRCTDRRSPR